MYFRNYRLQKRWLDKCLINPIPNDPSKSNKVSGTKHCCNLDDRTFTIFIDHCEHKSVGKSLF